MLQNTKIRQASANLKKLGKLVSDKTLQFVHLPRSRYVCITLLLISVFSIEIGLFNLPFWQTLSASNDSAYANSTLGSGLYRRADGYIVITNPSQAYMDMDADGTSQYVRIDSAHDSIELAQQASKNETHKRYDINSKDNTENADNINNSSEQNILRTIRVRINSDGIPGVGKYINTDVPSSLYIKTNAQKYVRLWIEEPTNSVIDIRAVSTNVRVPFRFDAIRIILMLLAIAVIYMLRPHSPLWNKPFNIHSKKQRITYYIIIGAIGSLVLARIIVAIIFAPRELVQYHQPNAYTYDFNQYAHLADALLHGKFNLNLPVPTELTQVSNPYNIATRNELLAKNVQPIFWDYAYYNNKWYSYFGVIPAILFYLPFQAITSIWVPGGIYLPNEVPILLCTYGFIVFGSLLAIRVIRSSVKKISVAAVILALTLFFIGSNTMYLLFRTQFYPIPIAASMFFTSLGLWFWTGAIKAKKPLKNSYKLLQTKQYQRFQKLTLWNIGTLPSISLPHLSAGAICIALNFGCRPIFCLSALLGIAIFKDYVLEIIKEFKEQQHQLRILISPISSVVIPALIVITPLAIYNALRFGSIFNFGNKYQITITDMTQVHLGIRNLIQTIVYYLALPLTTSQQFPWLQISQEPFTRWVYTEPRIGGVLVLCPLLLLSFGVFFIRKHIWRHGYNAFL
ncbi:MAG: hypothetical protein Q3961_04495, partial [Bifidobacteriaceae bacterium]|nr:hypothetical protein [Bifidobacteriaceae bacterium]